MSTDKCGETKKIGKGNRKIREDQGGKGKSSTGMRIKKEIGMKPY